MTGSVRQYQFYVLGGESPDDTMYVVYPDVPTKGEKAAVYNVQSDNTLAMRIDRSHAAMWLRIRHAWANGDRSVFSGDNHSIGFYRWVAGPDAARSITVPHRPVGAYESGEPVLHGVDGDTYGGRRSGTDQYGSSWTEFETDGFNVEYGCECSDPECNQDALCEAGDCECGSEECEKCGKCVFSGWMNMDGGTVRCYDHEPPIDERPDGLFKKTGTLRGEALPRFAWPGGYLLTYYTKYGSRICADCADKDLSNDPADDADADEELNCEGCQHPRSNHGSVQTVSGLEDVGPCNDTVEHVRTLGARLARASYLEVNPCLCPAYLPQLCDDCQKPLDPALRAWWADATARVTA